MSRTIFDQYSVNDVAGIIKERVDAISSQNAPSPADVRARQMALGDIAAYNSYDASGRPVPPVSGSDTKKYEAALMASQFLSQSFVSNIPAADESRLQIGNSLIKELTAREITGPTASPVLLTPAEFTALKAGNWSKLETQLNPQEQKQRGTLVACIHHAQKREVFNPPYEFHPVYDPDRMTKVEKVMQLDSTASWLLGLIKESRVPILLNEYVLPSNAFEKGRLTAGNYIQDNRPENGGIKYMMLFTNFFGDPEMASALTHEGRHHWQFSFGIPKKEYAMFSPADLIVFKLLNEADAHSIQAKANKNFKKTFGRLRIQTPSDVEFSRVFYDLQSRGVSVPTATKRATQATFIHFVKKEFEEPVYLNKYIGALSQDRTGNNLGQWTRALPGSRFLTDEHLTRLSRVGGDAFYLDHEGMAQIRQMFIDKLPKAIEQVRQNPGSIPSPG